MNKKNIFFSTILYGTIILTGCQNSSNLNENTLSNKKNQSIRTYSSDANHPPVALSKEYKILTDTNLLEKLSATDEDNDTLRYKLTQIPQHGIVELNETTGIFLYMPNINFDKGEDCFKFQAIDEHNTTSQNTKIDITIIDNNIQIPNSPSNLKAENIQTTKLILKWQDNSENESKFIIFQDSKKIAETEKNQTFIEIKNLKAGKTYEFCIKASNKAGCSSSDKIIVSTPNETKLPNSPSMFKLVKKGTHFATLSWNSNSENENGYKIYDEADNLVKNVSNRCNQTTIKNLQSNQTYTFIIKAYNDMGESSASNKLTFKTCPQK